MNKIRAQKPLNSCLVRSAILSEPDCGPSSASLFCLVTEKEHCIGSQKMKANPLICLCFLTYEVEIILPFSVVIRIKKISVSMENFKSYKCKVLLLLILSFPMVVLVLLKNKTFSLNLLLSQYIYRFFSHTFF